jgi:hypothetical protein
MPADLREMFGENASVIAASGKRVVNLGRLSRL